MKCVCEKLTELFYNSQCEILINDQYFFVYVSEEVLESHKHELIASTSTHSARIVKEMRRRYPRLFAKDRDGETVSIPLSIAPRLFADERFVSLPQRKVDEIAEANERVRTMGEGLKFHENVGSSITGATQETSEASSSQVKGKRVRKLWTSEEDEVVRNAVMNKESGGMVVDRLPGRSRSAVLKRFYVMKERMRREGNVGNGKEELGNEESLDEYESYDEMDEDEDIDEDVEDGYRPDEDMDVIAPL